MVYLLCNSDKKNIKKKKNNFRKISLLFSQCWYRWRPSPEWKSHPSDSTRILCCSYCSHRHPHLRHQLPFRLPIWQAVRCLGLKEELIVYDFDDCQILKNIGTRSFVCEWEKAFKNGSWIFQVYFFPLACQDRFFLDFKIVPILVNRAVSISRR